MFYNVQLLLFAQQPVPARSLLTYRGSDATG